MGVDIHDMDYLPLRSLLINAADTHCGCQTTNPDCKCPEGEWCKCPPGKCGCLPYMGWYYIGSPYEQQQYSKTWHPVDEEVLGPNTVRSTYFRYLYWKARCYFGTMDPMGLADQVRRVVQLKLDDLTPTQDAWLTLHNMIEGFRAGGGVIKNKDLSMKLGVALMHSQFIEYCSMVGVTDERQVRGEFAAYMEQNARKPIAHASAKLALAMNAIDTAGPAQMAEHLYAGMYQKQYAFVSKVQGLMGDALVPYVGTMHKMLLNLAVGKYKMAADVAADAAFSSLYMFFNMEIPELDLCKILKLKATQRIHDMSDHTKFLQEAMKCCEERWKEVKYDDLLSEAKTLTADDFAPKKNTRDTRKMRSVAEAVVSTGDAEAAAELMLTPKKRARKTSSATPKRTPKAKAPATPKAKKPKTKRRKIPLSLVAMPKSRLDKYDDEDDSEKEGVDFHI